MGYLALENLQHLLDQTEKRGEGHPDPQETRPIDENRIQTEYMLFNREIPDERILSALEITRCGINARDLHITADQKHRKLEIDANLSQDGKIIGEVHLAFERADTGETVMEIKHIEMIPNYRGEGVGLDLQCQLEAFCKDLSIY